MGLGRRELLRISRLRQGFDGRPSRVGEIQKLGHLVEGLPRSIVPGLSQEMVFAPGGSVEEEGVPAGDQKGDEGGLGPWIFKGGRKKVGFHVVDRNQGLPQGEGNGLGPGYTDQKRPDKARPRSHTHRIHIRKGTSCLVQSLPHHLFHPGRGGPVQPTPALHPRISRECPGNG